MALIIKCSIRCDKCSAIFEIEGSSLTGMQLRKEARPYGWTYSGKDLCGNCRPKNLDGNDFKHSKHRTIRSKYK